MEEAQQGLRFKNPVFDLRIPGETTRLEANILALLGRKAKKPSDLITLFAELDMLTKAYYDQSGRVYGEQSLKSVIVGILDDVTREKMMEHLGEDAHKLRERVFSYLSNIKSVRADSHSKDQFIHKLEHYESEEENCDCADTWEATQYNEVSGESFM